MKIIKQFRIALAVLAICFLAVMPASAVNTAQQTVTFSVSAINEISVSGNPGALTVSTATAGSAPNSATDATTTWAVTSNETNRIVTAAINAAMPTGTTLQVTLAAPTGATSAGAVTLSTTAANVVTGISKQNQSAMTITYSFSATSAAGTIASTSRTVTFTLTAGA